MNRIYRSMQKYGSLIQTVLIFSILFVLFAVLVPNFGTLINLATVLRQLTVILIISAGITVVFLVGEFDISVGAGLAFMACTLARLIHSWGIPAAIAAVLITGLGFGLFHGILVTKIGIASFIVTLGTRMMTRSLAFVITRGQVISDFPEQFLKLNQLTILTVPLPLFLVIAVYAVLFIVLRYTPFGKKVFAIGENPAAAAYSGVNVDRVKIIVFMISGFLVAVSSILLLSRLGGIQPYVAEGLEFECIAAVAIGGTSLSGGRGNVLNTLIGVFIVGFLRNALNLSQINTFWQNLATGIIIIVFALLDAQRAFIRIPPGVQKNRPEP